MFRDKNSNLRESINKNVIIREQLLDIEEINTRYWYIEQCFLKNKVIRLSNGNLNGVKFEKY